MSMKVKIKKGDQVVVTTGRDKGMKGQVLKVMPKDNKIVVAGINLRKRHMKPSMNSAGGIVSKESLIHISNVAHIDPQLNVHTKIGFKNLEDGTKVRYAKKSGAVIDAKVGK